MERKKRSQIWLVDRGQFQEIVRQSSSISEILVKFGLVNKGGNYQTVKARLLKDHIDFSHIPLGLGANKGKPRGGVNKVPIEELLTTGLHRDRSSLKKRLISEGLLPNQCAVCGLSPEWNGQPLVMVLDHINGIGNDYRLTNLRLLCPNCNSQTDTFAGRNRGESVTPTSLPISTTEITPVWSHAPRLDRRKVSRPGKNKLKLMLTSTPVVRIAKRYGVSDNAIRKWAKSYGLEIKKRKRQQKTHNQ